jgi:hypothetical protein
MLGKMHCERKRLSFQIQMAQHQDAQVRAHVQMCFHGLNTGRTFRPPESGAHCAAGTCDERVCVCVQVAWSLVRTSLNLRSASSVLSGLRSGCHFLQRHSHSHSHIQVYCRAGTRTGVAMRKARRRAGCGQGQGSQKHALSHADTNMNRNCMRHISCCAV